MPWKNANIGFKRLMVLSCALLGRQMQLMNS